ncbi:hypothetical protein H0A73_11980 [Alcaligenaceae bacterium]|nr:hypothetical protein [Alcaligenaceae bacterium]
MDDLPGTDGDDVFNAPLSRAGELPVSEQTLQGIDKLDGGEGYDVLNASLNGFSGAFDAENPEIANIEQYNLTVAADGAVGALDLARANGYEVLQNLNSRGYLDLYNVNVDAAGAAPTIALTNVRGNTAVSYDTSVSAVEVQNVVASQVGSASNSVNLRVDVIAASAGINTLNLDVSNGVYLNLSRDAQRVENLNITGSGVLQLTTSTDFVNLVSLNSADYSGDLNLDISGSVTLENAVTGEGDDTLAIHGDNFVTDNGLNVDFGGGTNQLILTDVENDDDVSNLDFVTNTVTGMNTGALIFRDRITLADDATLDLDGLDDIETLLFHDVEDSGVSDFTILNSAANLTIDSTWDFEIDGAIRGGFETLGVITGDDASFELDGEVGNLTDVTVNAGGEADIGVYNAATLVSLAVAAGDDASVVIDTTFDDEDSLDALETVNVTSTAGDVDLSVEGNTNPDGSTLASLTEVNVVAAYDADVVMQDISGEFALDVQAGLAADAVSGINNLDADVSLSNVGVTSVNVAAGDDADVYIDNAPNLVSVDVVAGTTTADGYTSNADVELVADADNFDSLTTVNVSASSDATLEMRGTAGQPGVQPVQAFTIAAGALVNTGSYVFSFPGYGLLNVDISGAEAPYANNTSTAVAQKIINAINTLVPGYSAVWEGDATAEKLVTITGDNEASADWIQVVNAGNRVITERVDLRDDGQEFIAGEGFDGLETITVDAGEDADVELTDVSGNFDLVVTAGDDAWIDLDNTGAVTVTVTAVDHVDLDVQGDTIGNSSLETIEVASDTADITLEGDLSSFTTLDVSGVATLLTVDASAAEYDDFVTYEIGATGIVNFTAQDYNVIDSHREVFKFVGEDVGTVVIDNFDDSPIAAVRDALDFSAFANITGAANLAFADDGLDLVITAADGQFDGAITLVGLAGQADFVADFSIIYM